MSDHSPAEIELPRVSLHEIPSFKMNLKYFCAIAFLFLLSWPSALQAVTGKQSFQYVIVDKTRQLLLAYENGNLVFQTRISTGKWDKSTPAGIFPAGEKHLMHYSKRYHNAPMPFSVQVTGNIFIHGYTDVPDYPASHGCIRVPLSDGKSNPAKVFFEWVQPGTPIAIIGGWKGPVHPKNQKLPSEAMRPLARSTPPAHQ